MRKYKLNTQMQKQMPIANFCTYKTTNDAAFFNTQYMSRRLQLR